MVFALCWLTVYVDHYFWYVRPDQSHMLPTEVQFVFNWLAHANSAINPCLYVVLNGKFREELSALLLPLSSTLPKQVVSFVHENQRLQPE